MTLDEILEEQHIVVCTGAGGVGKTTTSAALALRAADMGRHVIVCTIDPARRLAQSLGLEHLDNSPHRVPDTSFAGTRKPRGHLHAMMLDMKRTFDEMILDMTTKERAEKIFSNPFYQHVSSTLAGTQEYMAMEKLWELHEEGKWELIVIDTPPSRSALDFLDGPRRLSDFLEGRFLRLMLWPYMKAGRTGLKMLNVGTRALLKTVTKITGSDLFADVADFFQSFEGMYETFRSRSVRVRELMGARRTSFVVVTSPTEASLREARFFVDRLRSERMPLGGIVVNRTHTVASVQGLEDPAGLASRTDDPKLRASLEVFASWRTVSIREERLLRSELGDLRGVPVWRVPDLADDVVDAKALREVGALLAG